ncbi:MAG: 30S ribosomal protein S18 [Candidatus Portnoybacteria bacterium]|nr:30S ribosomal protein S18 [Candidatus Portnoybacteria bacterium]MDD4983196.1 30S ribosomal protein S18 [Candidatus Portnoybacteria bacterium]
MQKSCYFCTENTDFIDFKNIEILRNFLSGQAKILPPRRTGTCQRHQRILATAIKRARFMALLPFTNK